MGAEPYRYGFNGKENDNEVEGVGNQVDYGMRVYDPRIGRFLSVDPLTRKYAELTPYQFAGNTPIQASDLDGMEEYNFKLAVDNQGKTKFNLLSTKDVEHHSYLWGAVQFDTKILSKRYIVSYNSHDYYIGFPTPEGYGNEYASRLFELWKREPDATIFPLYFYNEEQSKSRFINGTIEDVRRYLATGVINLTVQQLGMAPRYSNPGHHDPTKQNFNRNKSILPKNAEELFNKSVADPKDPKTRWTKVGDGKKAEYHRFQSESKDGSTPFHWNGSTDATLLDGTPNIISPNDVPIEIKRIKPAQ